MRLGAARTRDTGRYYRSRKKQRRGESDGSEERLKRDSRPADRELRQCTKRGPETESGPVEPLQWSVVASRCGDPHVTREGKSLKHLRTTNPVSGSSLSPVKFWICISHEGVIVPASFPTSLFPGRPDIYLSPKIASAHATRPVCTMSAILRMVQGSSTRSV